MVLYNGKSHVILKTDNSLQTNVNEKIVKLLGVKVNHNISIELYLTEVSKKSHALARLSLIYLFIYLFIYLLILEKKLRLIMKAFIKQNEQSKWTLLKDPTTCFWR